MKQRMINTASDPRQVDYFPPMPAPMRSTYGVCVECGACVSTEFKDRHIAWHEEAK